VSTPGGVRDVVAGVMPVAGPEFQYANVLDLKVSVTFVL
jgi:hypothetical protein